MVFGLDIFMGRAKNYGKNLAVWVNYTIESMPEDYKRKFIRELKKYSFEVRKKGEPRNSGCVYELEDIIVDIENPKHLAKLIKESVHLMYQKGTASRVLDSLLENI